MTLEQCEDRFGLGDGRQGGGRDGRGSRNLDLDPPGGVRRLPLHLLPGSRNARSPAAWVALALGMVPEAAGEDHAQRSSQGQSGRDPLKNLRITPHHAYNVLAVQS